MLLRFFFKLASVFELSLLSFLSVVLIESMCIIAKTNCRNVNFNFGIISTAIFRKIETEDTEGDKKLETSLARK